MNEHIKGYKVFNPDWTCRGFQYKVGETFTHEGDIEMCSAGFHFCQKASDCFNYYKFDSRNKVAEIEAIGLVETQGDKSATDKIKIVREISWQELLNIVNTGKDCTGINNTGDCNTGNRNTGDCNTGDWNTGNCNTGDWNTGNFNTGNCNTGDCNTGNWNTGNHNTGNRNTGDCNTGDWNTGNCNTGDWNTGNWNSTSYSSGFFNSKENPIYVFNKPTSFCRNAILNCRGMDVLRWNYANSWWVSSENMTDEEKKAHPEHETTGGYLKNVDFKTACRMMWKKLSVNEKQAVKEIPNFDADVFEEITGIKVEE
ncbi:MAG: pentapeptide repeat-containing protein [Huintestinicola sp.]